MPAVFSIVGPMQPTTTRSSRALIATKLVGAVCLMALGGCDHTDPLQQASAPPPESGVVTTFYPTRYFAQRIGGGLVRVECVTPPGNDPSRWRPDAATITRIQDAALIVINGAGFEQWVATASLPLTKVCDSSRVFRSEFVQFDATRHSHGAAGEHSHEGTDGHTWMDPRNATRQAEQIMLSMARSWPAHERAFRDNYQTLAADLAVLADRMDGLSTRIRGVRLLASHPAYNYLAVRSLWPIKNIDLPPDAVPTRQLMSEFGRAIAGADLAVVLFEEEPIPEVVKAVCDAGPVRVVVFSPAELPEESDLERGEDYLSIMNDNINRLSEALSDPPEPRS